MEIIKNLVSTSKYSIKCPHKMKPTRIVIHNTANDATARNEVAYMIRNNKNVSFHYAVDDKEIVQGIPENRNAWHSGDGNGKGNREGIAIEICYSKSGGDKFTEAEANAVELIVDILKRYGWGIDKVTKHQDYNGKYCPHRTLDLGWDRFIGMIEDKLSPTPAPPTPVKTDLTAIAKEVIAGKWGNGEERKKRLKDAGYSYSAVQAEVNKLVKGTATAPKKKSNEEIAKEVIAGKWGNGAERKKRLADAGYDYNKIQAEVNNLSNKTTAPAKKTNEEIAREVIKGLWGNGQERKDRLKKAGYNPTTIQKIVNSIS